MTDKYELTHAEQELMVILWQIKAGTVHEVMARLPTHRNLAYTSVSTMLRILQQKKILSAKKNGRQHIYKPVLNKKTYMQQTLKKLIKQIFAGDLVELMTHALKLNNLSVIEIEALQQLLDVHKKKLSA